MARTGSQSRLSDSLSRVQSAYPVISFENDAKKMFHFDFEEAFSEVPMVVAQV